MLLQPIFEGKVFKNGNSFAVRIPAEWAKLLNLENARTMEVEIRDVFPNSGATSRKKKGAGFIDLSKMRGFLLGFAIKPHHLLYRDVFYEK